MDRTLTSRPDADDLRTLARSAPWRFTTLHWTHRRASFDRPTELTVQVEAWLRRPWQLTTRMNGRVGAETEPPYTSSVWDSRPPTPPTAVEPVRRADGLVLQRPSSVDVDYDDPMTLDYSWVAMLDPVELAVGVELTDVHEGARHGRATWWATAVPTPGYEARCGGCCDLLPTAVAWRAESRRQGRESGFPHLPALATAYLVGLDVQTGVVVDVTPLDGTMGRRFVNDLHEVDGELTPPPAAP